MAEQTTDLSEKLSQLLNAVQQQSNPQQANPWAKAAAPAVATIQTVNVPISLETPRGKIRLYLSLPGEVAATPDSLLAALAGLDAAGYPLDIWEGRRGSSGWPNGSSSGFGNGFRRSGSGWQR